MNIGIVGSGNIAGKVLAVLKSINIEAKTICCTERSLNAAKELCSAYDISTVLCDYDEFLASKEFDTVYIATPHRFHYPMAEKALKAGKHVIVEKPVAIKYEDTKKLVGLAKEKSLFIFEAISTPYLPMFEKMKEVVGGLGDIKMVQCNFSQISSQYDNFKNGIIHHFFDAQNAGGALMDLGVYNYHYVVGLFGMPRSITYQANMEKGIDTSGVAILDYDSFKAVCTATKDSEGPSGCTIQGTKGWAQQENPANNCGTVTVHMRGSREAQVYTADTVNRLEPEFRRYIQEIDKGDTKFCYEMFDQSINVSKLLDESRSQMLNMNECSVGI